jgi:hypothetical protein
MAPGDIHEPHDRNLRGDGFPVGLRAFDAGPRADSPKRRSVVCGSRRLHAAGWPAAALDLRRPYADAGKSCTDKAQCEGACIAEGNGESENAVTGQCQKTNVQFGCFARIVNGKSTGTLCVD